MGEVVGHSDEDGAFPRLAGESYLPQMLMIVFRQFLRGSRRSSVLVTGGFHHHPVAGTAQGSSRGTTAAGQPQSNNSRMTPATMDRDSIDPRRVARRRYSCNPFRRCISWLLVAQSVDRASYQRSETHTRQHRSTYWARSIKCSIRADLRTARAVLKPF